MGFLGLVQLIPLIVVSIAGAPLVDRRDRRSLLIAMESAASATIALLLIVSLQSRPALWQIYVLFGLLAAFRSLSAPTRSAMIPRIVGLEQIPKAQALNQVMWNTAVVAGPALGGLIIARVGVRWAYAIDSMSYLGTITAAVLMHPVPPVERQTKTTGFKAIAEGFHFLKGHRIIQSTFVVDLIAMIFGMPRALFPVLAATQFHRGAQVVGLLFAAPGAGALVAALTSGWVSRVADQGRAVLVAVAVWGAGIAAFGFSGRNLPLALFFLAIAGAADVISAVFRSTILQVAAPDELRGRMSGAHILVVAGGPRLGDLEAGLVAQAFTPFVSVVSGGLACVAGVGIMAVAVPQFRRYRIRVPGRPAEETIPPL